MSTKAERALVEAVMRNAREGAVNAEMTDEVRLCIEAVAEERLPLDLLEPALEALLAAHNAKARWKPFCQKLIANGITERGTTERWIEHLKKLIADKKAAQ